MSEVNVRCKKSGTEPCRGPFCVLLALAVVLAGCEHGTPQAPNLVKLEKVDDSTKLKVTYTAYRDYAGREVKQGVYVIRYENGQEYIEANYDRGELNGKCTIFSEEGKPEVTGVYRNGKPWDGEFQIGHEIRKFAAGKAMSSRTDEK
jgi:hypothetical protein